MKIETNGRIVGKEVNPARGDVTIDGKTYPARGEERVLYVVIGDMSKKFPDLFSSEPKLIRAVTTKGAYLDIKGQQTVICKVEEKRGNYKLLSIDGIEVITKGNKDEEEDENDEE